jgi:hypothetical protein
MREDRQGGTWHESLESAVRGNSHAAFGERPSEKGWTTQYLAGGLLYSEGLGSSNAPWLPGTFSWFGQSRRLAKEYEHLCETSEAMMYATMTRLMLKRLARA